QSLQNLRQVHPHDFVQEQHSNSAKLANNHEPLLSRSDLPEPADPVDSAAQLAQPLAPPHIVGRRQRLHTGPEETSTWSLTPPNLIAQYNAASHRNHRTAMSRQLNFRDPALERNIYRRLLTAISLGEGYNRSVRDRITATVAHRIRRHLNLVSRRLSTHPQGTRIAGNLHYHSCAG